MEINMETETIKKKFDYLMSVLERHWIIKDKNVMKVLLAGVIAHYLDTDPLWLLLISPSSGLKTELLSSLGEIPDIYPLSSLTGQTLFSGLRLGKNDKEHSLLTRINKKILTLKDFTTVLTTDFDSRQKILAQLREVYDGKFNQRYGNGVEIDWSGRIGFLAGCTPIIDIHSTVYQVLGERFIQYRLERADEASTVDKAFDNLGSDKDIRSEIKTAVAAFFANIKIPSVRTIELPPEIRTCLTGLASFCVRARSGIVRDSYKKVLEYVPEPEAPVRLAKQLATLCFALAILEGRDKVEPSDYLIALKTGLDTTPKQRIKVINFLASEDKLFDTTEVAEGIGYSTEGARRHLEDLTAHELVKIEKGGPGIADSWQLSDRTKEYLKKMRHPNMEEGTLDCNYNHINRYLLKMVM